MPRVMKASACIAAKPILGRSLVFGKTRKRGSHSGWNFALNLYSDSIWNQRDRNTSSPRQARSTGPAPIRSPRASAERNIAKFSDTRRTPIAGTAWSAATISSSFRPGSAARSRRISSSEMPSSPQGTKCSTALRSSPLSPSSGALWAVTTTQASSPGSPNRPSAIEKPRSVSVPRQRAAASAIRSRSSRPSSETRRTWQE